MSVFKKGVAAAVMASIAIASSVIPAQAQSVQFSFGQQDRVVREYCDDRRYRRSNDCRDYRRGNWDRSDYNRFYGRNRNGLDNIASGLFGFTFGAIIGSAIANSNNNDRGYSSRYSSYDAHVDACFARYRSYDERSDTYLNYDGNRYRCNL